MTPRQIVDDLYTHRRQPTDAEVDQLLREGTYREVGEAYVMTSCLDRRLGRRYRELHREAQNPVKA